MSDPAVTRRADWSLVLGGAQLTLSGPSGPIGLLAAGGRWVDVGPADEISSRAAGLGATTIDLSDRVLLPGFVDGHNHQPSAARDGLVVATAQATAVGELLENVAAAACRRSAGSWVTTERSLTRAQLRELRYPTIDELSAAAPNHPVAVRFGAHTMVLNRQAFDRTGLASVADPAGGVIERDRDGQPTGPIHEYGVTRAVDEQQPVPDRSELVDALDAVQDAYLRVGITTVRVPGVRPGELSWYQELRDSGRWRMRLAACVRVDPNLAAEDKRQVIDRSEVRTGFGDDRLCLDGIKLFVDGGLAPGDRAPTRFVDDVELRTICDQAVGAGWGVACHAVSEQAIEMVLAAYAATRRRHGPRPRLVIEHALLATPSQVARCAELGIWLSLQPSLVELNAHLLGADGDRERTTVDVLNAHRAGARVALGSDWNATPGTSHRPYAPLRSVGHLVRGGGPRAFAEAVELHTAAGGSLAGRPRIGRLVPGAVADVLAFEDDGLVERVDAGVAPLPTDVIVGGQARLRDGALLPPDDAHAGT